MKKFLLTASAFVLLSCAFAPCAFGQAQAGPSQTAKDEVVRARRATSPDASKTTPDAKTANTSNVESSSKSNADSSKSQGDSSLKSSADSSKDDAAAAASGEKSVASSAGDAEVESLRAQVASAASPSERGRLQQALAARLADTGRKTEAVELLRTMLAEERFDPPFFYNTGNALARLGESNAAVDAYRKAVAQRHGNYSRAQHNLGVVLTRMGRWEEAEEALGAALRLENNNYAEASYSLGRLHALRGEAGLAIAEWQRTLRLDPGHADAAVALARALAEDGDPDQAITVLDAFAERAGRRGSTVPREVTVTRGEIVAAGLVAAGERGKNSDGEKNSGDKRGASSARVLSEEDDAGKSASASTSSASAANTTATLAPDTLAILRGARSSSTKSLHAVVVDRQAYTLLLGARTARGENRNGEAVTLYRRAIESNGGYMTPADLELGFTLITLRRNEEAIAALLAVVRKEGTRYPVVFYHLGRLYEHLGRTTEAGEAFARAAELMGDDSPQFFVDLSRVREREGRYADALAAAEQYVRLTGQSGDAPDWARELVSSLRKKVEKNGAQSPSAKN